MRKIILAVFILFCATSFASDKSDKPEIKADSVLVLKRERVLQLLKDGKPFKIYKIALGSQPQGAKTQQGDNKTPEGKYVIDSRNPQSTFHLSLHVSYPNVQDTAKAKARHVSAGGDIMIHGLPKAYAWLGAAHRAHDWTLGCIAVTNPEIEEIWRLVPNGTPIEIRP
jgi:murein L,D-transpeptidase YafK